MISPEEERKRRDVDKHTSPGWVLRERKRTDWSVFLKRVAMTREKDNEKGSFWLMTSVCGCLVAMDM